MKPTILLLLATFLFASASLLAQPYISCSEPPEHEFPEEGTLCDKHSDFDEDLQIGPSAVSSQLNTSYFQNLDIYITGTFHVNSWVWFDNCRLKMAPGAAIYIYSSGRLAFLHTDVFACEQRWVGMTMSNGGSLLSYTSHFEDADYLIRVNKVTGTLLLVNNIFNRNYIGIRTLLTSPSDIAILNFYTFVENTFDCTAPLFEKWDNNLPDTEVSYAGIQTMNTTGTIGQFNGTNRFQNMQHGIHSVNSTLSIRKCEFHDMVMLTSSETDGTGVYATKGYLSITDNPNNSAGTTGSEFLRNPRAGILVESTRMDVIDCDFDVTANAIGIVSKNNTSAEYINIFKNRFNLQDGSGVFLHRSAASGVNNTTNFVQNNIFNLTASMIGPRCVQIQATNMSTDFMNIGYNVIEILGEDIVGGISVLSNSDYFQIISNDINILTEASSSGIEMRSFENVFGSYIAFNSVIGGSYTGKDEGFHIVNTPNLTMCDNATVDLFYGQNLLGINDKMAFSLNTMDSHDIGLLVQGIDGMPGVIGEQKRTANQWFTPFSGYAAQNQSIPSLSPFYIHAPGDITSLPAQIDPPSGWFFGDSGDPEPCNGPSPYEPELTTFDTIVLDSAYSSPWPSDPAIWELNRRLMYKMKRFPDLQSRGSGYYADDSTLTYGLLAEADYRYFLAMQIDTVKLKILDSLRLEIDTLFQDIDLIDTVDTPVSDTIVVDPSKDAAKYTFLLDIAELDSICAVLKNEIRTQQIEALTDVLDFNDTITVTEDWEINQKAVNHFMIRVARGDTLESEDLDSLRTIAGKCIDDGGFATLAAVAFLPLCEWTEYEDVVCDRSSRRLGRGTRDRGILEKVYPNPASSSIHFAFVSMFSGRVLLVDALGKIIRNELIKESVNHIINIADLSGLYFYQLIDNNDHVISSGKVIIAR